MYTNNQLFLFHISFMKLHFYGEVFQGHLKIRKELHVELSEIPLLSTFQYSAMKQHFFLKIPNTNDFFRRFYIVLTV